MIEVRITAPRRRGSAVAARAADGPSRVTEAALLLMAALTLVLLSARPLHGQTGVPGAAADSAGADSTEAFTPPVTGPSGPFVLVGGAYGQRRDDCSLCAGVDNDDSFTAFVRLGRYLAHGIGLGIDASVWRRSRSDVVIDGSVVEASEPLGNTLGNVSLTLTYRVWQVYIRGGGGIAFAAVDVPGAVGAAQPDTTGAGAEGGAGSGVEVSRRTATGVGVGYTVGAGVLLPFAGPISITVFSNWNAGWYDLSADGFTLAADTSHRFFEVGIGLAFH